MIFNKLFNNLPQSSQKFDIDNLFGPPKKIYGWSLKKTMFNSISRLYIGLNTWYLVYIDQPFFYQEDKLKINKKILEVFSHQKWEFKKKIKIKIFFGLNSSYMWFHCVAKYVEGWLNICPYFWFIVRFG